MRAIRYYIKLNWKNRIKTILLICLLLYAQVLIVFIPLKYYYLKLKSANKIIIKDLQPYYDDIRLIEKVIRFLPLKISCLTRSLAIQQYFRFIFNIDIQINLSILYERNRGIKAHAWCFKQEEIIDFKRITI